MKKLLILRNLLMATVGLLGIITIIFSVLQFRSPDRYNSPLVLLMCICVGLIAYIFIEKKIKLHRKYHDGNK
ncbi:hypothetical protein [Halobacillus andaensis]|uniref:hypothetical protein n=1 Tax=Halobacillus andaensis TaxID=1176239 RepID=UPI003D71FFBD